MDPPGEIGVEAAQHDPQAGTTSGVPSKRLRGQADLEIDRVARGAGDQGPGPMGASPGEDDRPLGIADDHRAADAEIPLTVGTPLGVDEYRRHPAGAEIPCHGKPDVPEPADDDMPPQPADAELVAHLVGGT